MEFELLTPKQINLLKESLEFHSSEDHNMAQGSSLADRLGSVFGEKIPKIIGLTEEKINYYQILASENHTELFRTLPKLRLKSLFSKLKKAGYNGINGEGMKSYANISVNQMWNYFTQIKDDLDIFS